MPTASIAETAGATPSRLTVERRDERTIYSWRYPPMRRQDIVIFVPILILILISTTDTGSVRSKMRDIAVFMAQVVAGICLLILALDYLRCRFEQRRLVVSAEGIRIGRGWGGRRMSEVIPLDRVMGAKPHGGPFSAWSVFLMVPGHHGGYGVPRLTSREDAQWLADAIEAEIRARGYEL